MKPAKFDYYAPASLEETLALMGQYGSDAKILAGGQSLTPMLNMRLARPNVLVDLNRLEELRYLREENGIMAVGAMTRHVELEESPLVAERCPLLTEAVKLIGHPAIRNRGTVGGSIVHSDPAAELPAILKVLGGTALLKGPRGQRTVAAEELFLTFLTTSVEPDEVVVEVRFPILRQGAGWAVEELTRRYGDFAIVGVATTLMLENGEIADVNLVLTGVGGTPVKVDEATLALRGAEPTAEAFRAVAKKVREIIDPESDLHASAAYRRHLAGVLTVRALEHAAGRAQKGS
jgi:CO/xanthine dehydrogenase FAD-binding subunit